MNTDNLSPKARLSFRLTIVLLSWFTLLSCSSSPKIEQTTSMRIPQTPVKNPTVYEDYKKNKPTTTKPNYQTADNGYKSYPSQQTQYNNNSAQNTQAPNFDFNSITKERFLNWVNADTSGYRKTQINRYYQFIYSKTGYVPEMEQLLRSARSWLACGFEPYGIPPEEYWRSMVDTVKLLKLLKNSGYLPNDFELVSVYREPQLNRCAKGSSRSKHVINAAVDIKVDYADEYERGIVEDGLCRFWHNEGHIYKMGLGLYKSGTIHIDTQGQRTWGSTYTKRSSRCLKYSYN